MTDPTHTSRSPLRSVLARTLVAGVLLAALWACDWTVGPEPGQGPGVSGPVLLDVTVVPETIMPGDTVLFTAVLADSTEPTLTFEWNLAGGRGPVDTDTTRIRWTAPDQAGRYDHRVTARFYGGTDSVRTDTQDFQTIVEPPRALLVPDQNAPHK